MLVQSANQCSLSRAFGYGQGDIGGLILVPDFAATYPRIISIPQIAGAVVGTWNLGCLVGAAMLIFLSNKLGRKGSIVTGLVLEILGRVVQTSAFSFGQYTAGRFIAGLGNGYVSLS
jgi:predicted MFS family arabinose efflux permease